ncbi:MAG: COQ9 family protein [Marinibacterium sp.]
MTDSYTDSYDEARSRLLDAALPHVPFDGWSDATLQAAIRDSGVEPALARAIFPRGAVDLALAYHARGDQAMRARLAKADLGDMRFRDRVAAAVRFRIEAIDDKEAVRRAMTLFALPLHAADGARALWTTADLIWDALGDTADDLNWYTKRASLSGVIGSTLLYWLGDDSPGYEATWAFLDRRIDDVMQIEKLKAQVNDNPLLKPFMALPNWVAGQIHAPRANRARWPGTVAPPPGETAGTTGP